MNILFDIGHPAHVHLFKNFISYLKGEGYQIYVTSRDKDVTNQLLDHYGIEHASISKPRSSYIGMFCEFIKRTWTIYRFHQKYKFDLAFGTSVSIGFLSLLSNVKSYNFNEDDDHIVPFYALLAYPFASKICIPQCLKYKYWGSKRIKHNSLHELAYLHPNNFTPDRTVIEKYGLKAREYIIIRTSAFKAHHDINAKGVSHATLSKAKTLFENYQIISSSESDATTDIAPWDMHHVLAYSKLLLTDSQTMSVEASVLGIPSIRSNSFVNKKISCLEELEHEYGLTYGFSELKEDEMLEKIKELLSDSNLLENFTKKKITLLKDKVNLDAWMIDLFKKI